jgi:hypothetical protein
MKFITEYFKLWPGGKTKSDTIINSTFDILYSLLGWIIQYRISLNKLNKQSIIFNTGSILSYWLINRSKESIFLLILFLIFLRDINYYL